MFNAIMFVCFFFIEGKMSRYVLTYRNLRGCVIKYVSDDVASSLRCCIVARRVLSDTLNQGL